MSWKGIAMQTLVAALLLGGRAEAGVYADDLTKCLVRSANAEDHLTLVRWMFSAFSLHPALQSLTTLTPEQRDGYNKSMAALFERLLYVDCREEAIAGLKYEGSTIIATSFTVLGQVAGRDIFSNPQVTQSMAALEKYIDKSKQNALFDEAGVARPAGQ